MRLSLSINGTPRVTAAVTAPGYLSAHLNLNDRPKDKEQSKTVQIKGLRTMDTETIQLCWPKLDLQVGDAVEIRLLGDGDADAPTEVRRSSESPRTLFSRPELAKDLLGLVVDFESRLMQLLAESERTESPEEHKKFEKAVAHVGYEVGEGFLYPIYRRHKQLLPDELKGELL